MSDKTHEWVGGVRGVEDPASGETIFLAVLGDAATGEVLPPGSGTTEAEAVGEAAEWLSQMPSELAVGPLVVTSKAFAKAAEKPWPGMVRVEEERPDVKALLDMLEHQLLAGPPPAPDGLPSMRTIEGVTDENLHDLHAAAASFAAVPAWEGVPSGAILEILEPAPPAGAACLSVMGAGGDQHGLSFFPDVATARKMFAAATPDEAMAALPAGGIVGFQLDALTGAAETDVELFETLGLPPIEVDGRPCLPSVYRMGPGGAERPSADLFRILPDLLTALSVIAAKAEVGDGATGFGTEVHGNGLNVRFRAHYAGD